MNFVTACEQGLDRPFFTYYVPRRTAPIEGAALVIALLFDTGTGRIQQHEVKECFASLWRG